ncbi:response regulator transcription factor [Bradyrhizobium roseum]|uniref:response regulator transcription factor n=1 Tax=Bradyrhizobium roseum TaxID=3056648 RepID=UPI00260C40CB|nr:response regulator transcription factor [Bradyrhizobium roseus]WKA29512.1 response regulator transcription factor [Bradyrhizobium roseus]
MRVLVVEDEPDLSSFLSSLLRRAGFVVDSVCSSEEALRAIASASFDIAIVDRRLPDGDGLSVIRAARARAPETALLVLTARDAKNDVIEGLNSGADDYLVKPFEPDELLARVRAIARRQSPNRATPTAVGKLSIDQHGGASVENTPLALRRGELLILQALALRAGRVVTRGILIDAIYGFDDLIESNTLESQISRLRRKLRNAAADVEIATLRGLGYMLQKMEPPESAADSEGLDKPSI